LSHFPAVFLYSLIIFFYWCVAGELLITGDFDIRARIYAKREYVVLDDNIEKGMTTTVGAFEANGTSNRLNRFPHHWDDRSHQRVERCVNV